EISSPTDAEIVVAADHPDAFVCADCGRIRTVVEHCHAGVDAGLRQGRLHCAVEELAIVPGEDDHIDRCHGIATGRRIGRRVRPAIRSAQPSIATTTTSRRPSAIATADTTRSAAPTTAVMSARPT